eukprot:gene1247-32595_t
MGRDRERYGENAESNRDRNRNGKVRDRDRHRTWDRDSGRDRQGRSRSKENRAGENRGGGRDAWCRSSDDMRHASTVPAAPAPMPVLDAATIEIAAEEKRLVSVGNTVTGLVTAELLQGLFSRVLSYFIHGPVGPSPVLSVGMDPSAEADADRVAGVDWVAEADADWLRSQELCEHAWCMDGIEVFGQQLDVKPYGREKTEADEAAKDRSQAHLMMIQMRSANPVMNVASHVVMLEGLTTAGVLRQEGTEEELRQALAGECAQAGSVDTIVNPSPPLSVADSEPSRAFVR